MEFGKAIICITIASVLVVSLLSFLHGKDNGPDDFDDWDD